MDANSIMNLNFIYYYIHLVGKIVKKWEKIRKRIRVRWVEFNSSVAKNQSAPFDSWKNAVFAIRQFIACFGVCIWNMADFYLLLSQMFPFFWHDKQQAAAQKNCFYNMYFQFCLENKSKLNNFPVQLAELSRTNSHTLRAAQCIAMD